MEADRQAQEEEMEILMEVLDSDCFSKYEGATISGQMDVKLRLPDDSLNCKYLCKEDEFGEEGGDKVEAGASASVTERVKSKKKSFKMLTFQHLPPVTLHFTLPTDYPSSSKPIFTLSSKWLSRTALSHLCKKLDELWEENQGMAILFTWHAFLKEDALASLGFTPQSVYDLTPFLQALPNFRGRKSQKNSARQIDVSASDNGAGANLECAKKSKMTSGEEAKAGGSKDENSKPRGSTTALRRRSRRGFQERADWREKLDSRAVFERLPSILVQYLLDYETLEIEREFLRNTHSCAICFSEKRGTDCILFLCGHVFCKECVRDFFSLHIKEGSLECVKCPDIECKVVPTPNEVKELVGSELFERYDTLLLSKTLDSMSDIMTCPRVSCGRPVFTEPNEKLATCATCRYAFCTFCKMGYHGVEPCRLKAGETKELYEKYTSGSKEEKKRMEKTYGKKQLELLVQQTLSENWVDTQAKPCPHCKVPIEKFEGCNKVTCFKCSTYFCWICARQLDKQNPYFHFNDPSSPCYNNLFANVEGQAAGPEEDWFVVQGGDEDDDDDDWDEDEDDDDYDEDYLIDSDSDEDELVVDYRRRLLR